MEKDSIELRPIVTPSYYEDAVEELISNYFRQFIFLPLMRELQAPRKLSPISRLANSILTDRDKLIADIMNGTIYYYRGYFKGLFSAETVKEMRRLKATYNEKVGGWRVPQENVPYPIQTAILNSETAFTQVVERLQKKLNSIDYAKFAQSIPLEKIFERIVYKTNQSVQDTLKSIEIRPKISPEEAQQLQDRYVGASTEQVKASIKNFTEEQTNEMRAKIQEKILSGERYETLIDMIETSYGTSKNKAKFLARQETKLLTSKVRENRYKAAGITKYRWRCVNGSPNHPVRPLHKIHDNKIFSFDDPPIINLKGDRKNPSEDYNCRCIALPIVEFNDDET